MTFGPNALIPIGLAVLFFGAGILRKAPSAGSAPGDPVAPLPFAGRAELPTSGKPVGVLLHDFDGDGRALLVAATLDPGTLHMWTDPLTAPTIIPIPDYPIGPRLLRLATIDAVVIASRASEEVLVFAPTAEEPSKPLHRVPLGARPHALGTGPLVGAETPSVVVATLSNELVVIDHRGTSRFPLLDGLPTFVAVEPGRVIVGSQNARCARAYVLQPDGSLQPEEPPVRLGGIPRDYLRVQGATGSESWIAGGDYALWKIAGFESGTPRKIGAERVGTVPLDLEPMPSSTDVVMLSAMDLAYTVLRAGRATHRGRTGQDPWGLACGDFDGDGIGDLALANRGARRVSVVLGKPGDAFHEAVSIPVGRGPHSLACGDLNRDGLDEVLVLNAMDQELVVLSGVPEESTGETRLSVRSRHSAAPAGDALATADVDGDGNLDVGFLVRASRGARLRILFGDGAGGLAARAEVPDLDSGDSVGDLWLGDLDGDGSTDALIADPSGGSVRLLRGTSEGLVLAQVLSVPTSPIALAVDAEGRIFVGLGDPGPRVGLAQLELVSQGATPELRERSHVDVGVPVAGIAVLSESPGSLALLSKPGAGDGTGWVLTLSDSGAGWSESDRLPTGLRPYAIAAGDFDGDGIPDVFVGAQNSHHVNTWRGSPTGLERLPDIGTGRGILDLLLARIDPDGRAILVVANGFSNDVSLVRPR